MLRVCTRKVIVVGILLLSALPSLAAGDRCEASFFAKSFNEVSPAGSNSRPADKTLSESFMSLATRGILINQYDHRLDRRGLIVPNGGLCSSTCGANVIHAIARYTKSNERYFANNDEVIQKIVDFAWERYRRDAKDGLSLFALNYALEEVASELGVPLTAERILSADRFSSGRDQNGASEWMLEIDANTLAVLAVDVPQNSHAIVLTGYDRLTRIATYNDPMNPWTVYRAPVTTVYQDGRPTLRIQMDRYGSGPDVGVIRGILYVRAKASINR